MKFVIEYTISDQLLMDVLKTDNMTEIEAKRELIEAALVAHLDYELENIPNEILDLDFFC